MYLIEAFPRYVHFFLYIFFYTSVQHKSNEVPLIIYIEYSEYMKRSLDDKYIYISSYSK